MSTYSTIRQHNADIREMYWDGDMDHQVKTVIELLMGNLETMALKIDELTPKHHKPVEMHVRTLEAGVGI